MLLPFFRTPCILAIIYLLRTFVIIFLYNCACVSVNVRVRPLVAADALDGWPPHRPPRRRAGRVLCSVSPPLLGFILQSTSLATLYIYIKSNYCLLAKIL